MYYFIVSLATLLFSLQFMFNNGFQKENGSSVFQAFNLSLYTSIFGLIILLVLNRFTLKITLFSSIVAIVYSVATLLLNYATIKAFHYANLSVYSVFSMIGGMILPFLYGVLTGEEFKLIRLACCVLITLSILMTITDKSQSKKAVKYYIAVFFLNGSVAVISSFHQSFESICTDSSSFLMLTKIIIAVICILLMLCQKERQFKISKKSMFYCFGIAGLNSIANLLLLIALLHLPTSVQYPLVTGGTIVFSTLIDKLRKVKVTKTEFIAAGIALASSILMAL